MNNSFLLYTPFSEGKIITVTDPETGQPVQQVVQTVTDPETGKPTQITTPLPGTFWDNLFYFETLLTISSISFQQQQQIFPIRFQTLWVDRL